jgi:hypothetical protein
VLQSAEDIFPFVTLPDVGAYPDGGRSDMPYKTYWSPSFRVCLMNITEAGRAVLPPAVALWRRKSDEIGPG